MSYQLPPLSDEIIFENLVRDILRRVYEDKGIEKFGRKGQSQFGIDGYMPSDSGVTFQCKLKETGFTKDADIRDVLLSEMEKELEKTKGLAKSPTRFIFATTFKNDRQLQEKAIALTTETLTVEYWGWHMITERILEFAEFLMPIYYPQFPFRQIPALVHVTPELIAGFQTPNAEQLNKLAIEYYKINDRGELVLRVVCNDIDVRNDRVMSYTFDRLDALPPSATLWILGSGGSGKTTILNRLAVELARQNRNVYLLNLETQISNDDFEHILLRLKYDNATAPTVLCIDNPAADEALLEKLLRHIPDYCPEIHILLAERPHRYKTLVRTGCLTYLHGEEENKPINVQNTADQRQKVYHKLFDLLGISETDRKPLLSIALNERIVYVNATYSILLELRRQGRIDFAFDWDDYRKMTADLPGFRGSYKYIALFYLFGVKTPFTVLSKIFGADKTQQENFLDRFRGLVNEPVILEERRDASFRESINVRTKHEIVSEIFFREYSHIKKNELFIKWCEHTDFENDSETQTLINIFGAKKNYTDENPYLDFSELIDFLLKGYLNEKTALSPKLNATLNTAKFWLLKMQGNSSKAMQILENFHRTNPDDLHSRTELAKIYINERRLEDAERVLLRILEIKANDLNSHIELAKVYQKQNKLDKAEGYLQQLLEIDINSIRAKTELAKIFQKQNKLNEAESLLLEVLDTKPKDLQSRTELAKIFQRQNKLDKAEAVLMESLVIDDKQLHPRTELAKIYQRQNKLDKAEAVLMEILVIKPKDLQSRTELAKIFQRQGKLDKAEAVLMESIAIDDKQLHPRTELAKIFQRQGKLDKAEAVLVELLEINPDNLMARTELAKIYQRQGKLDKAEAVLMESIAIDDKQLHPRTELAKIFQRQGKWNEAEKISEEVLALDPLNNHAISELLAVWNWQGEKAKCLERFWEFIDQPNYRFSYYSQAPVNRFFKCCRKFNLTEEAKKVYERFESEIGERNHLYYERNFK